MSEASPEAWLSERSGAAPPSDSSLRRMLRLQGKRHSGIGYGRHGWLRHPRQWLGGQWHGLSPLERRAARSLQARPEEAQQPSPGTAKRGVLSLLAHPPPLEIGSCERLSERLRPPGSLTSSSEALCPAAAGCGAGLVPDERIWWSTCMAPASEPGVRLSCRFIVCSLAAGVSPKA